MQAKFEQSPSKETCAKKSKVYLFPDYETHKLAWAVVNSTTVAAATCVSIVTVQSPIKSILLNLTKNGVFIPTYSGGILGFCRAMYAGTSASFTTAAVRTVYVTETKNNKPGELNERSRQISINNAISMVKIGHVTFAALGDILVTQIPESLSHLRKVEGLLPRNFKWYTLNNTYQLMVGGFIPRYAVGLVHFTSLFLVEDEISKRMTGENRNINHFLSGACSGMTAGFFSYPFSAFKDAVLVKATVNDEGQLRSKNTYQALQEILVNLSKDPRESLQIFLANAAKQLPIRLALSGAIFSIVAGVGEVLGREPLKTIIPDRFQPSLTSHYQAFFNRSKGAAGEANGVDCDDDEKSDQPKRSI
jgi:hypothetical protein